jgi:thioredoxin-related protein
METEKETKKFLIHLVGSPRCGCCGRVLGEDTEESERQRNRVKPDSVFVPVYFCRSENCPQRGKRVKITPIEMDEVLPPAKA